MLNHFYCNLVKDNCLLFEIQQLKLSLITERKKMEVQPRTEQEITPWERLLLEVTVTLVSRSGSKVSIRVSSSALPTDEAGEVGCRRIWLGALSRCHACLHK